MQLKEEEERPTLTTNEEQNNLFRNLEKNKDEQEPKPSLIVKDATTDYLQPELESTIRDTEAAPKQSMIQEERVFPSEKETHRESYRSYKDLVNMVEEKLHEKELRFSQKIRSSARSERQSRPS